MYQGDSNQGSGSREFSARGCYFCCYLIAVTRNLTRSNLREEGFILAHGLRGYSPPWEEDTTQHPTRRCSQPWQWERAHIWADQKMVLRGFPLMEGTSLPTLIVDPPPADTHTHTTSQGACSKTGSDLRDKKKSRQVDNED